MSLEGYLSNDSILCELLVARFVSSWMLLLVVVPTRFVVNFEATMSGFTSHVTQAHR